MDLLLHIDQRIAENAEEYAQYAKKSISQLVEDYLISLSSNHRIDKSLGPITAQLAGIIKLNQDESSKQLLEEALMEKYL